MSKEKLIIFDTTMRDGEQSPGAAMTKDEKVRIARQLERMRVDVIEAGFPAASEGDFAAVKAVAAAVRDSTVCGLARANEQDVRRCGEAVKGAKSPRVHTFIATSPIHMEKKLRMEPSQVIAQAVRSVQWAREYTDNIEFSPEDAGRSDIDFKMTGPQDPLPMQCDRRLLSQAITNLIKNATEGVQAVKDLPGTDKAYRGEIEASVESLDGMVTISIIDNGCGLPKKDRNRLVEPYMTTRAKGTGIGLAVVHRVTEQHNGTLLLEDAPLTAARTHGAAVRMVLPIVTAAAKAALPELIEAAGASRAAE